MNFTGIDDPYEAPEKPEMVIDTEQMKPEEAAEQILAYLDKGGYLRA
jgi:adenylylsulfate kinase-like enzyme